MAEAATLYPGSIEPQVALENFKADRVSRGIIPVAALEEAEIQYSPEAKDTPIAVSQLRTLPIDQPLPATPLALVPLQTGTVETGTDLQL